MIIELLKKHEIPFTIILGALCFVISLGFHSNEFPGKHEIFSGNIYPNELKLKTTLYLDSNIEYRVTSFVETGGIAIRPKLILKVVKDRKIILDNKLYSDTSKFSREFGHYWAYDSFGFFSVPSSDVFQLIIIAAEYPQELNRLEVIVSEKASNLGRKIFIGIGCIIFLILFIRKGRTRVTLN